MFIETHDGVQDMACDTFIKIAQKCRRHFVQVQVGEMVPFIDDILNNVNTIICDLQPQQVHTFYEAVGMMISAQVEQPVQELLITKFMALPNQVWDSIIQQAAQNVEVLKDAEAVKHLSNILRTNVRACKSIGHGYVVQLGRIYLDMLNVYKVMSENISSAVAISGENVTKQPLIKSMKGVKKETLKLIAEWVSKSEDPRLVSIYRFFIVTKVDIYLEQLIAFKIHDVRYNSICCEQVADNFVPPLLDAVLLDYQRNVPAAREPEVLSSMAAIVERLKVCLHLISFYSIFIFCLT
jgi:exportin-1